MSYSLNGPTNTSQVTAWQQLTEVMAINNAVDYCNPSADTCTGFTVTWPTAQYSGVTGSSQTVTDSLGRVWTYTWTGSGITTVQPPLSTTSPSTYTYNPQNQVLTYSNGSATWTYAYQYSGSTLTTTTNDPSSHTRVVSTSTTTGLPASDTDGLGHTRSFAYDSNGRLTRVTLPEGDYVQYTLDGRGNATQTTVVPKSGSSLANIVTSAGYDATCTYPAKCNQPNSTTDANGNTTYYTYDNTRGVLLTVTPPVPTTGAVQPQTRLSYTLTAAQYKNSGGTIVAGSPSIDVLTSTSACQTLPAPPATNNCTSAGYTADEVLTTIAYGSAGVANNLLPTSVTTAAGNGSLSATTSLTYDNIGNTMTVQGPLGSAYTTRYRYDADRELIGVVSPNPGTTGLKYPAVRYTYNADGLVTLVEQGTVNSQSDSDWATFATLLQQANGYDTHDRALYAITANASGTEQSVAQYGYDNANHLQCATVRMNSALFGTLPSSPLGTLPSSACTAGAAGSYGPDRITEFAYDGDNRVNQLTAGFGTSAQANVVTQTYSANGLPLTLLDAMSNLTTNTYDGVDRLSQINYPSATQSSGTSSTTDYETYGYDANGNVVSDRRRDGTTMCYTFDALNRTLRKDYPGSGGACATSTGSVYYSYDLLNRLTSANYGGISGTGVSYAYDALSRTTSETEPSPSGTIAYQYDLAGDLTQITWPDAFYAGYSYDNLQRVLTVNENGATSGLGVLAQYQYDDLGDLTTATLGNGVVSTYDHQDDPFYRLYSLTHAFVGGAGNVTFGYSYNPAGQIAVRSVSNTRYTSHPSAMSTAYVASGVNSYTSVGGTSYSYDGRQNLTSDGMRTFTYDAENKLLTGSSPTAISLGYDPTGRLQTAVSGGVTSTWSNAGAMQVGVYSGSSLATRSIPVPGQNALIVNYSGSGASSPLWLLPDERGSIIATSDSTGAAVSQTGYGANGEPASWSAYTVYTGQPAIQQSQLYNFRARVYDPGIGRFMQTDPIGYAGGDTNLYGYVGEDPTNFTDPSGLDGEPGGPCYNNCDTDPTTVSEVVVTATHCSGGGTPIYSNGKFSFCANLSSYDVPSVMQLIRVGGGGAALQIVQDNRPPCPAGVQMVSVSGTVKIPFLPKWASLSVGFGLAIDPAGRVAVPVFGFAGGGRGASESLTVNYSTSNARSFSAFNGQFYDAGGMGGVGLGGGVAKFAGAGGVTGTTYSAGEVTGGSVAAGTSYTDVGPSIGTRLCKPR